MLHPAPAADRAHPHDHLVGFYGSDAYLARSVARFVAPALRSDGIALVLATPTHRSAFAAAVAAEGLDPDAERFVQVDAAEMLAAISVDGTPDADRFHAVIGGLIDAHAQHGRRVFAFGELVALLWEDGDVTGALALEEMWNELAAKRPFSLFCAYPTRVFSEDRDTDDFRTICRAHSAVIPDERYSLLEDADDQLRSVALLQQEAVASANEREAMVRERTGLRAELEARTEADRLHRQFTAMLVHDLRNPTIVISGVLALLRRHWAELRPEEVDEYLVTAARSSGQIERLVDDLLSMARLESGQFRYDLTRLDLVATVDDVAAGVRKSTGRTIEVSAPGHVGHAYADEGRQMQILDNLLSNAVKFSGDDTSISVRVEDHGDHLMVRVRDRGPGIAPSALAELFQPFSRPTQRPDLPKGTGLGLFITRALVEGQGGTIDVDSQVGVGSTFSYSVPTAAPTV